MRFFDTKFTTRDPEAYLAARNAVLIEKFPATDASALSNKPEVVVADVVPADALPKVTPEQMKQIATLRARAEQEIAAAAPLVQGEKIEEDLFSFLESPLGEHPRGTCVLHRRTNMAETCFVFPDVRILDSGLRSMPQPVTEEHFGEATPLLQSATAAAIAGKIAQALLVKLGTAILNEVFSDSKVQLERET